VLPVPHERAGPVAGPGGARIVGAMDEELDLREALLAEAEVCLDHGDPEGALQSAEEALRVDGEAQAVVEAHHLRALALRELGRIEEALQAVETALARDPGYAEAALTRGDLLIFDLGELERGLEVCNTFLREELEDTLYSDFLNLKGNALAELGDFPAALGCLRRAAELSPEREDLATRGWVLFELGRLEEAVAALQLACQPGLPQNAANHFYLAVARSRLGDERAAASHLRIAARLEPDLYQQPCPHPPELLLQVLEEVIATLPALLQRRLPGAVRRLVEWPDLQHLGQGRERLSPLALLQLWDGRDLPTPAPDDDGDEPDEAAPLPPAEEAEGDQEIRELRLFTRNLSLICPDRESLAEELQLALWGEFNRLLDLREADFVSTSLH